MSKNSSREKNVIDMAIFKEGSDLNSLEFGLMQDGSINLYFKSEILTTDLAELRSQNYKIIEFNCSKWSDSKSAIKSIAKRLEFSSDFGENLDALNDSLKDIDIPIESGLILVFHRVDAFTENHHEYFSCILDILESASRYHMLFGKRFITIAQSDDPKIEFEGISEVTPKWNRQEWLREKRGQ